MPLALAAILFTVFVGNVFLGALTGSPVLGDIGEWLVLFAASVVFVAAILRREAAEKNSTDK